MTKRAKLSIDSQFNELETMVEKIEQSGTNIDQAILDYKSCWSLIPCQSPSHTVATAKFPSWLRACAISPKFSQK